MSSRTQFFYRQRVTEAELNLAFDEAEQADRDLASDLGAFGIISGAIAVPHAPLADLSIDVTAPGRAYDRLGRRVFLAAAQTVDCTKDLNGTPTVVTGGNAERWLSVFVRASRLLSDPRTDGNNQTVHFRHDEAAELVVRQGTAAPPGQATRPALEPDELLVCDVRRTSGQVHIDGPDIDTSRRQAFVYAAAKDIAVAAAGWSALPATAKNLQEALDGANAVVSGHLDGVSRHHVAAAIDSKAYGFIGATNVQEALAQVADKLTANAAGSPGAALVGADAVAGVPFALAASNVDAQLAGLLTFLNAHATGNAAHGADKITAPAFQYLASTTVQAQLQEIVTKLAAQTAGQSGAGRLGAEPQSAAGAAKALTTGTVRDQLGQLLTGLNAQIGSFDAGHYRDDVANAGLHRAIRQPAFQASIARVLIWESFASNAPLARFRVYADGVSIWMVVGASWDGSLWQWDVKATGSIAIAFRIVRQFVGVYQLEWDASTNGGFTDFTRVWQLPVVSGSDSSGWTAVAAGMKESGRISLEGMGPGGLAGATSLQLGTSATFRTRFDQPPTVVLQQLAALNWSGGAPQVTNIDVDGFAVTSLQQNVPSNTPVRWVGRYVATR